MGITDSSNYNKNYDVTYFGVQFEWSETRSLIVIIIVAIILNKATVMYATQWNGEVHYNLCVELQFNIMCILTSKRGSTGGGGDT